MATDKASYRSGRSPSGRPCLSELTSTQAGLHRGPGARGVRVRALARTAASAARPIGGAIWPAGAELPPSPRPRLKLINGSAYRRRHRLRALSARHIYLCAEQKAHRGAGSCAPARGRGEAAPRARPPSLSPPPPAGCMQVRPPRPPRSQLRGPHAQPRAQGGRRRSVTISARILTRQDLLRGGGGAPGCGRRVAAPPPRPGPVPKPRPGSAEGGQQGLAHPARPGLRAPTRAAPLGGAGWAQRSPGSRAYRRRRSVLNLRSPCPPSIYISHHPETLAHTHTRTDPTQAHRGRKGKRNQRTAQIGTCGWF